MWRCARWSLPRVVPGLALIAVCAAGARAVDAEQRVDGFRTAMEKWVETRQILSEEKSEWEVEKETLQSTRELLRQREEALESEIAELDASITEADEERRELLLRRGEYQRSSKVMEEKVGVLEDEVKALVPLLPEPLQDKLEPLLVQIPEDPEQSKVSLGQRLVNVLGFILQSEKWNGTATFVGETRALDGDEQKVQVRTLYWGLAQAVYVDAQGRAAGIGRPAADGWTFSDEGGLADEAGLFVDIYEGNVDAIQFVKIPVEIREIAPRGSDRP